MRETMTNEEAIKYIIRHCNPDYPNGKTKWETAINMAIEALKIQDTYKWISCSERLPKIDDRVLVKTAWHEITIGWRDSYTNGEIWIIQEGESNTNAKDIISWMSFPESYQEVEHD